MLSYLESLIAVFGHSFGGQSSTVSLPDERNNKLQLKKQKNIQIFFQHFIFSELCGHLQKNMFGFIDQHYSYLVPGLSEQE